MRYHKYHSLPAVLHLWEEEWLKRREKRRKGKLIMYKYCNEFDIKKNIVMNE